MHGSTYSDLLQVLKGEQLSALAFYSNRITFTACIFKYSFYFLFLLLLLHLHCPLAPQEPPKWRHQPPKDTLLIQREGSEAVFRCKAIGRPRPKVKWIKDGAQMKTKKNKKVSLRSCAKYFMTMAYLKYLKYLAAESV